MFKCNLNLLLKQILVKLHVKKKNKKQTRENTTTVVFLMPSKLVANVMDFFEYDILNKLNE